MQGLAHSGAGVKWERPGQLWGYSRCNLCKSQECNCCLLAADGFYNLYKQWRLTLMMELDTKSRVVLHVESIAMAIYSGVGVGAL